MFGARRQNNGVSHEGSAAVRVNVVTASTAQQEVRRTVRRQRRTSALVICSPWAASERRAPRITVLSYAELTKHRLNTSLLSTGDMCDPGSGVVCTGILVMKPRLFYIRRQSWCLDAIPTCTALTSNSELELHQPPSNDIIRAHSRPCSTQATNTGRVWQLPKSRRLYGLHNVSDNSRRQYMPQESSKTNE